MKTPLMSACLIFEQIDQSELPLNTIEQMAGLNQELLSLEKFTREILFIAQRKNQSINTAEIDILDKVTKVEANYELLIKEKQLTISISHASEFLIQLDEILLEKIISNLISNAVFYSPHDSNIDISITDSSLTITNKIQDSPTESNFSHNQTGLGLFLINTMLLDTTCQLQTKNNNYYYSATIKKNASST